MYEMTGSIIRPTVAPAVPGAQGFDTDSALDPVTAMALKASGFGFAVRYLSRTTPENPSDLTAAEAALILAAGLALMAVQHCPRPGWAPSAMLGQSYGQAAVANAQVIGLPSGMTVWLDLEEVVSYASVADTIAYVNTWAEIVGAQYVPGLYVGANQPLTSDELYWRLRVTHYWKSASTVPDIAIRGYQMRQALAPSPIDGIAIDRDVILADDFGGVPLWLAPILGAAAPAS